MKMKYKVITGMFLMCILMSPLFITDGVSQDTTNSTQDENEGDFQSQTGAMVVTLLIGIIIGIIFFVFLYLGWWIYQMRRADEKRPHLLLLNPIERIVLNAGKFREYKRDIGIPVSETSEKIMWGVITDNVVVIPAYGETDDLIITGKSGKGIKIMMAQVIGTTRTRESAERSIKEWASYAFPESVWDIPPQLDIDSVPPNYVFVKPIYKAEWGPLMHRRGLLAVRNIYGEVNRLLAVSDREQEVIHDSYSRLLASKIQSATELIITMYYNVLKIWDTISEHRVLPFEVYSRIVHLPMDKLNYTGIRQAMQGGNLHEVAGSIIGNLRNTLDEIANKFGMRTMAEPTAKLLLDKLGGLQDQLKGSIQREYKYQSKIQDLAQRASQVQPQARPQVAQRAPPNNQQKKERPVMKMYNE